MKHSPKILVHLLFDPASMTPAELDTAVATVMGNAPNSPLYKANATIQAAVTEVGKLAGVFKTATLAVAATEGLLGSERETLASSAATVDRGLILLKDLVENKAITAEQASAVGFVVRQAFSKGDPIAAPDGVKVKASKTHGSFAVTAYDLRKRIHFAAQISVDPIGPNTWTDLPGNGKRRKLRGYPSGTLVWVRFAALRGQTRGLWGTPVSVNVP